MSQPHLLFEDRICQNASEKELSSFHSWSGYYPTFWSDQFVLMKSYECNEEYWNFVIFDLLMNEKSPIRFRKIDDEFSTTKAYSINEEFGFIVEDIVDTYRINFVRLDWDLMEFQLIDHFTLRDCKFFWTFIDKLDSSNFVFKWKTYNNPDYYYLKCQLIKEKVEVCKNYQSHNYFEHYSKGSLISVTVLFQSQIVKYDMETKKEEIFLIDNEMFRNVNWNRSFEWINERLYTKILCKNDKKRHEIVWADLKTKRWTQMKFHTELGIQKLEFFNGNLIIRAQNHCEKDGLFESEIKVYSIPMRKPNHLRYSAWLLVVRVMKNIGKIEPYESAREYLPLNSDLREPWFKDEEMMEIN